MSDLVPLFNQLIRSHGLPDLRRVGPKVQRDAERFASWCQSRQVDPARWILARHEAIQWRHRIPFDRLASEKFLAPFRAWGDDRQAADIEQERLKRDIVEAPPKVGLHLAEVMRGLLPPELCRHDPWTRYDDRSRWCCKCPLRGECRVEES